MIDPRKLRITQESMFALSKVRQGKTNTIYHLHAQSQNMTQMNLSMKQRQTHGQRTDLSLPRGGSGRGMYWELGIRRCKPLYVE